MTDQLGCIRPGALADLIAIPFDGPIHRATEAVIAHSTWVSWMMVHGAPVPDVASPVRHPDCESVESGFH
jgi:hypothetical protein